MKRYWPLILLLTACTGGQVHLENDVFGPERNDDKNFTHGTKLGYINENDHEKTSYSVSQNIYTPDRKHNDALPSELARDRAYTGYLYAEYRKSIFEESGDIDTYGIQMGCIGPCSLAKQTQKQVHRWINQNIPAWPLSDTLKSEPTLSLELQKERSLYETDYFKADVYGNTKLGNVVDNAAIGFALFSGYNIPTFKSDPIIFKVPSEKPTAVSPWTGYVFTKTEERLVAYNHVLQGSLFQDERHTVNSEWSVQELDAGFTVGYGRFKFTYTFFVFSNEWTTEKPGGFSFGGLDFSW